MSGKQNKPEPKIKHLEDEKMSTADVQALLAATETLYISNWGTYHLRLNNGDLHAFYPYDQPSDMREAWLAIDTDYRLNWKPMDFHQDYGQVCERRVKSPTRGEVMSDAAEAITLAVAAAMGVPAALIRNPDPSSQINSRRLALKHEYPSATEADIDRLIGNVNSWKNLPAHNPADDESED